MSICISWVSHAGITYFPADPLHLPLNRDSWNVLIPGTPELGWTSVKSKGNVGFPIFSLGIGTWEWCLLFLEHQVCGRRDERDQLSRTILRAESNARYSHHSREAQSLTTHSFPVGIPGYRLLSSAPPGNVR